MQAINENLSLGGVGKYLIDNNTIESTIGGVYDKNDNFVAFQWDKEVIKIFRLRLHDQLAYMIIAVVWCGATTIFLLLFWVEASIASTHLQLIQRVHITP